LPIGDRHFSRQDKGHGPGEQTENDRQAAEKFEDAAHANLRQQFEFRPPGIPPNQPKSFSPPAWRNNNPTTIRSTKYAISFNNLLLFWLINVM
jgi:hypothetical protein